MPESQRIQERGVAFLPSYSEMLESHQPIKLKTVRKFRNSESQRILEQGVASRLSCSEMLENHQQMNRKLIKKFELLSLSKFWSRE